MAHLSSLDMFLLQVLLSPLLHPWILISALLTAFLVGFGVWKVRRRKAGKKVVHAE